MAARIPPDPASVIAVLTTSEKQYWHALALKNLGLTTPKFEVETFIRQFISERIPNICRRYRGFDDIRGILKVSVPNFAVDLHRARKRDREKFISLEPEPEDDRPADRRIEIALVQQSPASPERLLLETESEAQDRALVEQLLSELSRPLQDVAVLEFSDTPRREAASRLGITTGVFSQRVNRVFADLRKLKRWRDRVPLLPTDIRDGKALSAQIQEAGSVTKRCFGHRLWTTGTDALRQVTAQLANGRPADPKAVSDLAAAINDVLSKRDFYESGYFHGCLPSGRNHREVQALLRRPHRGAIASSYLHRLMFDDAYQLYIFDRPQKLS